MPAPALERRPPRGHSVRFHSLGLWIGLAAGLSGCHRMQADDVSPTPGTSLGRGGSRPDRDGAAGAGGAAGTAGMATAPPAGGGGGAGNADGASPTDAAAMRDLTAEIAPPRADARDVSPELPPQPVVAAMRPFGSRPTKYPADRLRPTGADAAIDAAVASFYTRWKAAYLTAGCDGLFFKAPGGSGSSARVTNSQIHGMGMHATALMAGYDRDARSTFDGLAAVSRKIASNLVGRPQRMGNGNLMGRGVTATCEGLPDGDAQTDGDIPIAMAFWLAHQQWGSAGRVNYLAEARATMAAIKAFEMNAATKVPLLGDWCSLPEEMGEFGNASHPADFAFDHFRAFAAASGDRFWLEAIDATYGVVAAVQAQHSPVTGLFPEYLINTAATPSPPPGAFLSEPNAGAFTADAALTVFRFASDYAVSGEARAKTSLVKIVDWLRGATAANPMRISRGYRLDGTPLESGAAPEFEAVFATAIMVAPANPNNQAWLDALWKRAVEGPMTGFFADTVRLHALLLLSGNW